MVMPLWGNLNTYDMNKSLEIVSVVGPLQSGIPTPDPTVPRYAELGFNQFTSLFLIMDDTFLAHWQEHREHRGDVTAE
ncbi:hypothetical protein GGS23DRAFT_591806 [Durotheca rogersii]|uniref:uncharacterized protein n=1 Tax=Durotheca rogersii TaxID=419775 RepID=UPI002220F767|nr:uncharacterized protein GGS23DRAFT_591806 [Durotheca rogersii]KAI5868000.1 hypothetical protein GGS23DRAFT_591806 [Durotheca rogersii]